MSVKKRGNPASCHIYCTQVHYFPFEVYRYINRIYFKSTKSSQCANSSLEVFCFSLGSSSVCVGKHIHANHPNIAAIVLSRLPPRLPHKTPRPQGGGGAGPRRRIPTRSGASSWSATGRRRLAAGRRGRCGCSRWRRRPMT